MAENQQGKAHAQQNQAAQVQQSVPPVHVIIDPSPAIEYGNTNADNGKHAPEEKPLPRFLRPEWIIVYITAFYVAISALMLFTIKRQAKIMETQAKDARESGVSASVVAQGTLDALIKQAAVMEFQAGQMVNQTLSIQSSVMAAQQSADAANAQIQMMKDKERARISVSISDDEFEVSPAYSFDAISIDIANDGTTSAFNVKAKGEVFGQPSEDLPFMGNFIPLRVPSVIRANNDPTQTEVILVQSTDLTGVEESPIPYFFHIGGVVEYEDVFGQSHETTFRYKLQVTGVHQIPDSKSVKIRSWRGWKRCGSPQENRAT